jgi:hypothetical protein
VNSHVRTRIQEMTQEVATDCAGGSGKEYIHVEWLASRAGNLTILLILLRCAMSYVPHLKTALPFSVQIQNRGRMPVDGRLDIRLN